MTWWTRSRWPSKNNFAINIETVLQSEAPFFLDRDANNRFSGFYRTNTMTKILLAILAALSILLMPLHSYADKAGKGPSDQAQKNASDNASFNRDNKDKDKKKNKDKDSKDKDGKDKEKK